GLPTAQTESVASDRTKTKTANRYCFFPFMSYLRQRLDKNASSKSGSACHRSTSVYLVHKLVAQVQESHVPPAEPEVRFVNRSKRSGQLTLASFTLISLVHRA